MKIELEKYIDRKGKRYKPSLLPSGLTRGPLHECFDNAALEAMHSGYTYVEGFAYDPRNDHRYHHAWITDGVHAFDVTWSAFLNNDEIPVPFIYVGVEFDMKDVADFMTRTGYKSLFENEHMYPGFLNRVLK